MDFIMNLFSANFFIYWVEIVTILAMLCLLGYVLVILNVFKKD